MDLKVKNKIHISNRKSKENSKMNYPAQMKTFVFVINHGGGPWLPLTVH